MRKSIFYVAALATLAISCNYTIETIDSPVQDEVVKDHPVFYASFEGQESKAGFGKTGDVYIHYWELGDFIYIYPKGETNPYPQKYVCTNVNGTFEYVEDYTARGTASGTPDKNYAAYTSNPEGLYFNANTHKMTFGISASPEPVGPDHNGAYGYANNMIAASDDNTLEFKNCIGWLKLQLKGTQKVSSIVIAQAVGNKPQSEGDGIYVTYDGTTAPSVESGWLEFPYNIIEIAAPYAQLSEEQATDFYIPMAPLTLQTIKAFIYFADGSFDTLVNYKSDVTIERNAVTPMSVKTVGINFTDLSASETANCYIIKSVGCYKFKATVKGNSNESVGTPVSATTLWTTYLSTTEEVASNETVVSNVTYLDGYVYFQTPDSFKNGNSLIAVKDAGGNILWSWHIWASNTADLETPDDHTKYQNGIKLMRYNLGASSLYGGGDDCTGLYYQQNRKDPFVGYTYFPESKAQKYYPSNVFVPDGITNSPTIASSVAAPTTFYGKWAQGYWPDDSKGVYDPCPPGWRVPSTSGLSMTPKVNTQYKISESEYGAAFFTVAPLYLAYFEGSYVFTPYKAGHYYYWLAGSTGYDHFGYALQVQSTTSMKLNVGEINGYYSCDYGAPIRCRKID